MKKAVFAVIAAACMSQAAAQSDPGVPVYPGAKPAPEVAEALKKQMNIAATTYRTSDSVEKVAEFYRKQSLKEGPGTSKQGAMFSGNGVNLTIQNPWLDMKSGKVNNDTLVSIVKARK
jgi:hypothetical protein